MTEDQRRYEEFWTGYRRPPRTPAPGEPRWRATLYCGHAVEFTTRADMTRHPSNPYDLRNGRECPECGRWCVYVGRPTVVAPDRTLNDDLWL